MHTITGFFKYPKVKNSDQNHDWVSVSDSDSSKKTSTSGDSSVVTGSSFGSEPENNIQPSGTSDVAHPSGSRTVQWLKSNYHEATVPVSFDDDGINRVNNIRPIAGDDAFIEEDLSAEQFSDDSTSSLTLSLQENVIEYNLKDRS